MHLHLLRFILKWGFNCVLAPQRKCLPKEWTQDSTGTDDFGAHSYKFPSHVLKILDLTLNWIIHTPFCLDPPPLSQRHMSAEYRLILNYWLTFALTLIAYLPMHVRRHSVNTWPILNWHMADILVESCHWVLLGALVRVLDLVVKYEIFCSSPLKGLLVAVAHSWPFMQTCPGLNANEIQIPYDNHHKVPSLVKRHQNTYNYVQYEVIWKCQITLLNMKY